MDKDIKYLVEKLFDDDSELLNNDELILDEMNIANNIQPYKRISTEDKNINVPMYFIEYDLKHEESPIDEDVEMFTGKLCFDTEEKQWYFYVEGEYGKFLGIDKDIEGKIVLIHNAINSKEYLELFMLDKSLANKLYKNIKKAINNRPNIALAEFEKLHIFQ